jgi:hypothetical protein
MRPRYWDGGRILGDIRRPPPTITVTVSIVWFYATASREPRSADGVRARLLHQSHR